MATCLPKRRQQDPQCSVVQVLVGRKPEAPRPIISSLEYGSTQSHCPCNLLLEEEFKKAMARNNQFQHHPKHTLLHI
jgi:hypothetical protein